MGEGEDTKPQPGATSPVPSDSHEDQQLRALQQAVASSVAFPTDAFVIGEPVSVTRVDYDGNRRRGLTACCRTEGGSEYVVSLADVRFDEGTAAAPGVLAYRRWLGLAGTAATSLSEPPPRRGHKAAEADIDVSLPVDLVILSVKESAARCRLLGSRRALTLKTTVWDAVPGEIVTVRPRKHWRYAGHPYLSGDITSRRVDASALELVPLRLEETGLWDPKDEHWGEAEAPIEAWAEAVIARGPRPEYEMEQVLPATDPDDPEILARLLEADLRRLDAHAHLGNLAFDHNPWEAVRHYEVGARIGELSLGSDFDGVLSWGLAGNRPFLRCLKGYGLCLWRLDRLKEAARVFERMLWMNPADNQGIRTLLPEVQAGGPWHPQDVGPRQA